MLVLLVVLLAVLRPGWSAMETIDKCELRARLDEQRNIGKINVSPNIIDRIVYSADEMTHLNMTAETPMVDRPGMKRYGVFGLIDFLVCKVDAKDTFNICNMECKELRATDITLHIDCLSKLFELADPNTRTDNMALNWLLSRSFPHIFVQKIPPDYFQCREDPTLST